MSARKLWNGSFFLSVLFPATCFEPFSGVRVPINITGDVTLSLMHSCPAFIDIAN